MRIVYFAWMRERVGVGEEEVAPPAGVTTVDGLMVWLAGLDEAHAHAFADPGIVRAAIDQRHVRPGASIDGVSEVAFFPPMTGG